MWNLEVFIVESWSINALAPGPVKVGEIAALGHKSTDNTMKYGTLQAQGHSGPGFAFFTSAEGSKVLACDWTNVCEQFHGDLMCLSTFGLADGNFEKNAWIFFR